MSSNKESEVSVAYLTLLATHDNNQSLLIGPGKVIDSTSGWASSLFEVSFGCDSSGLGLDYVIRLLCISMERIWVRLEEYLGIGPSQAHDVTLALYDKYF